MNTNHTSTEESGGTGLLLVVSFATIFVVAGEPVRPLPRMVPGH
jgi:hypothetical protein